MQYLGDFAEDATLYIPFNTFDSNDPQASVTATTLIASDLYVHKDGSVTNLVTDGATIAIDFDGVTGNHLITIDTSVSADYSVGSDYFVRIEGATVDAGNVNAIIGSFSIENRYDSQTGDSYARLGAPAGASVSADLVVIDNFVDGIETAVITNAAGVDIAADIIAVKAETALIVADTNELQTDDVPTLIATAQSDLDTLTGTDGATLATSQANYAPAKAGDSMDMSSISGDATAADNLEATYDGTGYTDDAAPATQAQIGNLATGSAAISAVAESDTVTTGGETNTFAVTDQLDGIYHQITDTAGAMEFYYQFDVGGNGVATEAEMTGRLNGANDSLDVFAYNWSGASWDQIGTIQGSNSTTDGVSSFNLVTRHTGTGANLGKVRIRAYAASGLTSATLYIDQSFVSYAVVAQSVGYAQGRVWVNTASGTAGTESYVNGVADNQVLTFADALTIAGNVGLKEYNISTESTLTLAANLNDSIVYGVGYALNFGGFDVGNTHFYHASPVNGIAVAASGHVEILDSIIANITVDESHFTNCTLTGTITLGSSAGDVRIVNCRSGIAGSTTPILDFGTATTNHDVFFANYQNGIEIRNFNTTTGGGTDLLSISGTGKLVIASTCDGGTINLRGQWEITDNSGGAVTIAYDDVSDNIINIIADTNELQTDWANGGRLDLLLDQVITDIAGLNDLTAAQVNAEVVDALVTDTYAESSGVPAATASLATKIQWLATIARNKVTQTATTQLIRNDADSGTIGTSTVSDDGTTFIRGEFS